MKKNKKNWIIGGVGVLVLIAAIFVALKFMGSKHYSPAKGLDIEVTKESSSGKEVHKGQLAKVQYTGWLLDGTKFDSSKDRNEPFEFRVGDHQVIRGWDLGVEGMKVGEIRKLRIGPDLAYGAMGAGRVIPPDATLLFEVELVDVAD